MTNAGDDDIDECLEDASDIDDRNDSDDVESSREEDDGHSTQEELNDRRGPRFPELSPKTVPPHDEQPEPERGSAPADRADEYLNGRKYQTPAGLQLRRHRGQWLRYTGTHYEVLTQEALEADITNYFNDTTYRNEVNASFVSRVIHQVTARCLIPNTVDLPAIDVNGHWIAEPMTVTFTNGTITMEAVRLGVPPRLYAHNPKLVSRCLLPYDYLPSAECPAWLGFLEQVLPDEGSRRLLQQIFGYCLTTDVSLQKFFMFEGTGGNGKGVVTGILGRMVGFENTSSLSLDCFHDKHDLVVTLGKLVNFTSELGEKDRISEKQLKLATGGDTMHFNPKYREPFPAKFTAKIIISTNTRPAFADRSNGIWRRMSLLPFPVTITPDQQNPRLEETLAVEMPGILNWAIEGAISLYRTRRFEEPQVSVDARLAYQKESNPARLFLDDCCEVGGECFVGTRVLYQQYKQYALARGYKPLNEGNFKKEVLLLPGVKGDRVHLDGAYSRGYRGITITSPEESLACL